MLYNLPSWQGIFWISNWTSSWCWSLWPEFLSNDMESSQQAKRGEHSLSTGVVYLQKGTVKCVASPVPSTCRAGNVFRDNDVLQWWMQAAMGFFSQIRLISVIIAPSSLHWGAVPLLCSHEGTLASLRSCCCLCSYTGNGALENVFFDLGRVCVGQTPLGGFSLSAGAQLLRGGRKEPRTPPMNTWCWSRALSDMPLPPVYTFYVQNNIHIKIDVNIIYFLYIYFQEGFWCSCRLLQILKLTHFLQKNHNFAVIQRWRWIKNDLCL